MGMKKGARKVRKSQKVQEVGRPGAGGIVIEKPKAKKSHKVRRNVKVETLSRAKNTIKAERTSKVKRTYKDSMFRAIFREKENLLSLYNAIQRTHHTNVEDLEMNMLENAIYMGYKNDISFVISVGVQKVTRSMKGIFSLFCRYFHSAYVSVRVAYVP